MIEIILAEIHIINQHGSRLKKIENPSPVRFCIKSNYRRGEWRSINYLDKKFCNYCITCKNYISWLVFRIGLLIFQISHHLGLIIQDYIYLVRVPLTNSGYWLKKFLLQCVSKWSFSFHIYSVNFREELLLGHPVELSACL